MLHMADYCSSDIGIDILLSFEAVSTTEGEEDYAD